MKLTVNHAGVTLTLHPETDTVSVTKDGYTWVQNPEFVPELTVILEGEAVSLPLRDAQAISYEAVQTGVGEGWKTVYSCWQHRGSVLPFVLETSVWCETETGRVFAEVVALTEVAQVQQLSWPAPFIWEKKDASAYTVLPMMQGTLIPSNWPREVSVVEPPIVFDRAAYMPWMGQIDGCHGWMQIMETPWDCGYSLSHPAGGPTLMHLIWRASLAQLSYKRTVRLEFFSDCDYNTFCKSYRSYVREHGRLKTLRQKAADNPKLLQLAGCPVIHSYIWSHIKPEAFIYDHEHPERNQKFASFAQRRNELARLKEMGLQRAYFHLDGWGVDGYDREHPDILPPCEKAGGAQAMRQLQDACREWNILFALHDQYRDYYHDAKSYNSANAIHGSGQSLPGECTWNGGQQNYLCTALTEPYIRRNYMKLKQYGIEPDGVYLDVYSVVSLDECFHPEHRMTRRQCSEYRGSCCELLRARGIILSSEEASDHLVPHLELCHYAPYPGVVESDGNVTSRGIPVPLFNLVYHDCLMIPWQIDDDSDGKIDGNSRYLYAMLNGGMPYLAIDANTAQLQLAQQVAALQEQVAFSEMVRHEFVDGNPQKQRTVFSDGTTVTVDFDAGTCTVEPSHHESFAGG